MIARVSMFRLEGHTGEFSDRKEWTVAVFPTEALAVAYQIACEEWANGNHFLWRERDSGAPIPLKLTTPARPRAADPECWPAIEAWLRALKENPAPSMGTLASHVISQEASTDWEELDLSHFDWRDLVEQATAKGIIHPPDPDVCEADYTGVFYRTAEVPLVFTARGQAEELFDRAVEALRTLP